MPGALEGITVIELAAIGPVPFAGMMLADHGARVIQIERPGNYGFYALGKFDILGRNRERVAIDLKSAEGIARLRELCAEADALIEGFRPGVLERMGLDPAELIADNPRLVVGRMTGWGQEGPLAAVAGHDINYIALAGVLHTFGRAGEPPSFPTNTVGDYGGGGMLLAFGVLAAILSARTTGKGQVVDCAMIDGASLLGGAVRSLYAAGVWRDERGVNVLDGGAPYYEVYATADGEYITIGPIEDHFHAELMARLGLNDDPDFAAKDDPALWPRQKQRLTELFAGKTCAEWCALLEGTDVCFAPVLSMGEAPGHAHNAARGTFVELDGVVHPAPAPRFSGTPAPVPKPAGK